MQISRIFDNIWNIQQELFDISLGRSWQNFLKSEQETLSDKLDSAIFNFRLPPSIVFARDLLSVLDHHPVDKPTQRAETGAEQEACEDCFIIARKEIM